LLYGLVAAVPGTGLGETVYKDPVPVAGMSAFCAAAALGHADLARAMVTVRRERAREWDEALTGLQGCAPLAAADCGYLRYPALARVAGRADALASRAARAGVARGYPRALPSLEASAAISMDVVSVFPGATLLADNLLTLPTHRFVSAQDREWVHSSEN
jgi:dTDP-4-amino-4,6-dideoxygalactose transaminase